MEIVTTIAELRYARQNLSGPVGLVPTMGYLHEGHLSLAKQAAQECASVVASIFVNPTQFALDEDLAAYPRDLPRDLALLEKAGVNLVWNPSSKVMYPAGYQTWITVEEVTQPLEGAMRPGHFKGVATVVAKLFNGVLPDKAYFGQKDAQQVVVIKQMVRDLNFSVEIVVCPIVRESDGLAMSSRNTYLNPEQRKAATVLYRALSAAKAAFNKGQTDADQLRAIMTEIIQNEPLARLQYVSCSNPSTLDELYGSVNQGLLSMAVFIGKTRLIDNMMLEHS